MTDERLQTRLRDQLDRDAAVGAPIAALASAVLFALLALGQDWIGSPDRTALLSATPLAVALYSGCVWLALRRHPATAGNAHPILLSLCLVIAIHHGTHQYVLAEPWLTTNPVLAALACAYFFSSRPWFLAAIVLCILSWLPAAALSGPFSPEWRHWTATLASGIVLAIAAFEAKRMSLIRLESLRMLSEERKAEAEQALAQAEIANADRLAMEQAMHEAQRRESLGILAGGIAHDFNNLLTVIRGNVELTQVESALTPEIEENLGTIASAADRATQLTHQLLVYSGRAQPKITKVDLGLRIHGTAGLFRSLLSPDVELTLHGQEEGIAVSADAALLDQVIINFVQNSIEACSMDGGRIDVRWDYWHPPSDAGEPDRAFIEVSDTGRGMGEKVQRRMFEPFYTTKKGGTGLGLAAVKGIADSHGAEIDVTSEPGIGTTMRFTMPLGTRSQTESSNGGQATPQLSGPVLIVDDQSGVRRVARGYLEAAGYPVVEAHGASSALAMAGEDREGIGAALIDLTMPGTSGYEVALNLRRRLPGLPIVIMSGFDRHDSLGEHPPKEELPFLQKPFTQSQLLDALARAIESRR